LRQASSSIAKHAAWRCSAVSAATKERAAYRTGASDMPVCSSAKKSRHDLATAGDSPEGLSQTRMGPSSMGFSRGGKLNGRAAGVGGRFRKPKCAYSPAILCSS